MHTLDLLAHNLLSPMVLAFALGALAVAMKSDLRLPPELGTSLGVFLLLAIGLKGGAALRAAALSEVAAPIGVTLALGVVVPIVAFALLRALRFARVDAAALAAHYGSVSAVTFAAALAFVDAAGVPAEPFLPALVAVLEVPAIIVGLLLARELGGSSAALREIFTGRSIILLVGGLLIGWGTTAAGYARVAPLFVDLFQGVLVLFLLDMGMTAAKRLPDLRVGGARLLGFALLFPLLSGALGVLAGTLVGLSLGGTTVLGVMSASASYIAAPAAVRVALPDANPAYYLTAAIAITFPFNLVLGLPILHQLAAWVR